MWLLKSPLDLKLSLLTFNLFVILKTTSQLGEHQENTRRTPSISHKYVCVCVCVLVLFFFTYLGATLFVMMLVKMSFFD
jgi:hypothetical protein